MFDYNWHYLNVICWWIEWKHAATPACILFKYIFNFSFRLLILSAEVSKFSPFPCILVFTLFRKENTSTKYANLEIQLISLSNSQNSCWFSWRQKRQSILNFEHTHQNFASREASNFGMVLNMIGVHVFTKLRKHTMRKGRLLIKLTILTTWFKTFWRSGKRDLLTRIFLCKKTMRNNNILYIMTQWNI